MADLASLADVEAALGRPLTPEETELAPTLLSEASDITIGYLGCDPTDTSTDPATVPAAVTRVVARMVARVVTQSESSAAFGSEGTTEQVGPFSRTVRFAAGTTTGQPWLASTDKIALRPYRCGGGMVSVRLSTEQTGRYQRYRR